MDNGAELTLQIIQRAQQHSTSATRPFPNVWTIWPYGERVPWSGACAFLTALPKPIALSPLIEPAMFGVWTMVDLNATQRQRFTHQLTNQAQYYAEKLAVLRVPQHGEVRFGQSDSARTMSVAAFNRWAAEYALSVGISLEKSTERDTALVIVRRPGGGGPPLVV